MFVCVVVIVVIKPISALIYATNHFSLLLRIITICVAIRNIASATIYQQIKSKHLQYIAVHCIERILASICWLTFNIYSPLGGLFTWHLRYDQILYKTTSLRMHSITFEPKMNRISTKIAYESNIWLASLIFKNIQIQNELRLVILILTAYYCDNVIYLFSMDSMVIEMLQCFMKIYWKSYHIKIIPKCSTSIVQQCAPICLKTCENLFS